MNKYEAVTYIVEENKELTKKLERNQKLVRKIQGYVV